MVWGAGGEGEALKGPTKRTPEPKTYRLRGEGKNPSPLVLEIQKATRTNTAAHTSNIDATNSLSSGDACLHSRRALFIVMNDMIMDFCIVLRNRVFMF